MKNNLLILGAIVVVAVLGLLIFLQLRSTPSTPAPTDGGGTTFPTSGVGDTDTATLSGRSGASIEVTNFLNDPTTAKDPQNAGYYNLGFHNFETVTNPPATDNPPYTITFISTTQFFNVSIFKEPIGAVRKEAQEYLRSRLGISEDQMCDLKYSVATPEWVNAAYAGKDLKFSFCPGSIPLSE